MTSEAEAVKAQTRDQCKILAGEADSKSRPGGAMLLGSGHCKASEQHVEEKVLGFPPRIKGQEVKLVQNFEQEQIADQHVEIAVGSCETGGTTSTGSLGGEEYYIGEAEEYENQGEDYLQDDGFDNDGELGIGTILVPHRKVREESAAPSSPAGRRKANRSKGRSVSFDERKEVKERAKQGRWGAIVETSSSEEEAAAVVDTVVGPVRSQDEEIRAALDIMWDRDPTMAMQMAAKLGYMQAPG